jgi:hypothetical protein
VKRQLLDRSDRELYARMAKAVRAGLIPPATRTASNNEGTASLLWERLTSSQLASSRISSITNSETGTTSSLRMSNLIDAHRVGFIEIGHGLAKLGHSLWKLGQDGDDVVVERLQDETVETEKWSKRKKKGELEDALSDLGYPRAIQSMMESTERRRIVANLEEFQPFAVGESILIRGHIATITGRPNADQVQVRFEGSNIVDLQPVARIMDAGLNGHRAGFEEQAQFKIAAGTWSPKLTASTIERLDPQDRMAFHQFIKNELKIARKLASPSKEWTEWNGIWVRDYTDLLHGEIAMLPDVLHWELFATGELVEQGRSPTIIDAKRECDQAAEIQFPKAAQMNQDVIEEARLLGAQAFANGRSSAPAQDPDLLELVRANSSGIGSSIPLLEAWQQGWHRANLDAPIEGSKTAQEHAKGDLTRLMGLSVINELYDEPKKGEVVGVVDDAFGKQQWIEVQYENGNYGRINPDVCGFDRARDAIVIVAEQKTAQQDDWVDQVVGSKREYAVGAVGLIGQDSSDKKWKWELWYLVDIAFEGSADSLEEAKRQCDEAVKNTTTAKMAQDDWQQKVQSALNSLKSKLGPDGFDQAEIEGDSVRASYRFWRDGVYMTSRPGEEDDDHAEMDNSQHQKLVEVVKQGLERQGLNADDFKISAGPEEKWWMSVSVKKTASRVAYDPEDPDEDFSPPDIVDEFEFRVDGEFMGVGLHISFTYTNDDGEESFPEYKLREDMWDWWLDNGGSAIIPDDQGPTDQQLKDFDQAMKIDEVKGCLR